MVRGASALLEPDVSESDAATELAEGAYVPKAVYNVEYPQERILIAANPDGDHALDRYAEFQAGVYLCTSPHIEKVLRQLEYLFWENIPAGQAGRSCPHCRWSARNDDAVFAHIAKHAVESAL